jgi:hypothetical protein
MPLHVMIACTFDFSVTGVVMMIISNLPHVIIIVRVDSDQIFRHVDV